eukprot:6455502-Ditylum_brightwellii.AAC.1
MLGRPTTRKEILPKPWSCTRNFLTHTRTRLGNEHRDVAVILKCITVVHQETKEYEKATDL